MEGKAVYKILHTHNMGYYGDDSMFNMLHMNTKSDIDKLNPKRNNTAKKRKSKGIAQL